jgi:DNA-binding NarL/FixJ family response regulator
VSVPGLSEIEQEVVLLVAGGRSHREVAATLRLSLKTVEWHAVRAERKLEHAASLRDRIRQAEPRPTPKGGSA